MQDILMGDYPDAWPPWWETTLMKDHPIKDGVERVTLSFPERIDTVLNRMELNWWHVQKRDWLNVSKCIYKHGAERPQKAWGLLGTGRLNVLAKSIWFFGTLHASA